MIKGVENIGKRDLIWSYTATIFTIGAGIFLYPFILVKLPAETVGIWNIFQIITSLVALLDFGFQPSFSRNISYIFSGATSLQKQGMNTEISCSNINYGLLNKTIAAMRHFYRSMALVVLFVLATAGTTYIVYVCRQYSGSTQEVIFAWILLIGINCFNLYTFYYDALMTGKGMVRQMQQINIVGQLTYILLAIALLYAGWGLIAIVASQFTSTIIKRVCVYRVFFRPELCDAMLNATADQSDKEILSAILPNAIKLGVTSMAGFVIYKFGTLIGGAILPLALMGSYGITFQVTDIIARMGSVYYQSFVPKIAQYRIECKNSELQHIYLRSVLALLIVFGLLGGSVLLLGNPLLKLLGSKTMFLPTSMFAVLLLIHLLERNHVIAWGFVLAKNEVPFMWPSVITAGVTLVLTYVLLFPLEYGIWGLIIAPGIAQLCYQNWRWPQVTISELWGKRDENERKEDVC